MYDSCSTTEIKCEGIGVKFMVSQVLILIVGIGSPRYSGKYQSFEAFIYLNRNISVLIINITF